MKQIYRMTFPAFHQALSGLRHMNFANIRKMTLYRTNYLRCFVFVSETNVGYTLYPTRGIPPTQHPAEGVAAVAWARYYDVDIVCDPCNWRAELATHTGAHHPTPWSSSRRVGLDGHSTAPRPGTRP